MQSALARAQTIDLPPPRPADAGQYPDLSGLYGEDIGLASYAYLAFEAFGVNIPALTYLYFVIVAGSLVLYSIGQLGAASAQWPPSSQ